MKCTCFLNSHYSTTFRSLFEVGMNLLRTYLQLLKDLKWLVTISCLWSMKCALAFLQHSKMVKKQNLIKNYVSFIFLVVTDVANRWKKLFRDIAFYWEATQATHNFPKTFREWHVIHSLHAWGQTNKRQFH
jgi:hypothetical protein